MKNLKSVSWMLVLLWGGLPCAHALAQGTGGLSVLVSDDAGRTLAGALVEVRTTRTNRAYAATADGDGLATFRNVESGPFTLIVQAAGREGRSEGFGCFHIVFARTVQMNVPLRTSGSSGAPPPLRCPELEVAPASFPVAIPRPSSTACDAT